MGLIPSCKSIRGKRKCRTDKYGDADSYLLMLIPSMFFKDESSGIITYTL
jgi:hypothetical protein